MNLDYTCNEKDWKLFRQKLPDWQARHMEKVVEGYKTLINSEMRASDIYWELDKRIRNDKRSTGVIVHDVRRSRFLQIMLALLNDGVITMDDLDSFSDDLQETLQFITSRDNFPYST